jgi:hypothetical protein
MKRHLVLQGLAATAMLATALAAGPAPLPAAADSFADPAFLQLWQRNDFPVAQQRVARSWTWGKTPFAARQEPYAQGPAGTRLVQYFDKSRMEINNPAGDPNSPWYITNGLLVVELMTGRVQIGDNEFQAGYPANVPVAGDAADPSQTAPTYASLARVASLSGGENAATPRPPDTAVLDYVRGDGTVEQIARKDEPGPVNYVRYSSETHHNIPNVFWDFMNSGGLVYENGQYSAGPLMSWIAVMGYPITEPYWTTIRVGGSNRPVLVQAFQRRVLTYSPRNPPGWQVEMGNVGRAYYSWRYDRPTCATTPVRGFGVVWGNTPSIANALGCPQPYHPEEATQTAVERFQHGTMLYVSKTSSYEYATPSIFVLFDDGTYQRFEDTYVEGKPNACNPGPVPTGYVTPQRGFNKVWCEGAGAQVRARLGWAIEPEKGGAGAWQQFDHGVMFWTAASNQIFALVETGENGALVRHWQAFADTFQP